MTVSQVSTGTSRILARFDGSRPLSIVDAQDHLYSLGALLFVSYLEAGMAGPSQDFQPGTQLHENALNYQVRQAKASLHNTRLERISYNSPLEVMVTISSIMGSLTAVASPLIFLHNNLQEARIIRADADLQVEARRIVLRALRGVNISPEDIEKHDITGLIEGAADSASALRELEVLDESD